jgi:hypothetical protein
MKESAVLLFALAHHQARCSDTLNNNNNNNNKINPTNEQNHKLSTFMAVA